MFSDIFYCLSRWRLVHLIGITGLRSRYARSKLGQLWLTLFTAVQIIVTGIVWSMIWKMEIHSYLPYVGIGHVIYLFISQSINESAGCIVAEARLFYNDPMPLLMAVFSHIYKHIIIFSHNIPIVIGLVIYGGEVGDLAVAFFVFILALLFVFFSSVFLSVISTRYRDVAQISSLIFQLTFLVTPIMWKLDFVPEKYRVYFLINPFASILELMRNSLLGLEYSVYAWYSLMFWLIVSIFLALILHKKYRRNFIFWL
jgi:lipopolysaccharide transport system permease protein